MRFEPYGMARARSRVALADSSPHVAFFWEASGKGTLWAATNFGLYFSLEFSRDYSSRSTGEKVEFQLYSPCCAANLVLPKYERSAVHYCTACHKPVHTLEPFRYTSATNITPVDFTSQGEAYSTLEPLAATLALSLLQERFIELFETVTRVRAEPRVSFSSVVARPADAPLPITDRLIIAACKKASGKL